MTTRIHNEWFMSLSKTTCPCGCKKTQVFAWGEYATARWRTVEHFCQECFPKRVLERLLAQAKACGCAFQLQARCGHILPAWLKLPGCLSYETYNHLGRSDSQHSGSNDT